MVQDFVHPQYLKGTSYTSQVQLQPKVLDEARRTLSTVAYIANNWDALHPFQLCCFLYVPDRLRYITWVTFKTSAKESCDIA